MYVTSHCMQKDKEQYISGTLKRAQRHYKKMSSLMKKYLLFNALINRIIDLIILANGYVYYMLAIMAGH